MATTTVNKENPTKQDKKKLPVGYYDELALNNLVAKAKKAHPEKEAEWGEYLGYYYNLLEKAKRQREQYSHYLDNHYFSEDYKLNEDAANSFLQPAKNKKDKAVNTGVTEKKIEVVEAELLSLNLEPEVRTSSLIDDIEYTELGDDMGAIIKRTNQIEKDKKMWRVAVHEMLTQRAVFIRDRITKRKIRDGSVTIVEARKEVIPATQVFLGDVSIPQYRYDDQPYIVTYERFDHRTIKSYWKDNPNFDFVVKGNLKVDEDSQSFGFEYRMARIKEDEVEQVTIENIITGEKQVILNGVPMYEPGSKGIKITGSYNGFTTRMFTLKSQSLNYAYGRPLTASSKYLQFLSNESIRLLIRKWYQALEPPMAMARGRVPKKNIFDPATITKGIKAKDFEPLIKHTGVTQSEFNMQSFIESKAAEFIGQGNLQQGIQDKTERTAREISVLQAQAAKQLGNAVASYIEMVEEMSEIRLHTVLDNFLEPVSKRLNPSTNEVVDKFRQFTINNIDIGEGLTGKKVVQFSDRDLTNEELVGVKEFQDNQKKIGKNVKFSSINVKKLKKLPLNWFIVATPTQKDGSDLDKIMFQDKLTQGAAVAKLTGDQLNGSVVKEDYMNKWKAPGWFQQKAPQAPGLPGDQMGEEEDKRMQEFEKEIANLEGGGGGSSQRQGEVGGRTQQPL